MHHLPQIFSKNLHSFEFLEGNDFTPGSLMHWSYDIGTTSFAFVFLFLKIKLINTRLFLRSVSWAG